MRRNWRAYVTKPAARLAVILLTVLSATLALPRPAAGQTPDGNNESNPAASTPTAPPASATGETCQPAAVHFEQPELWSYPGHNLSSVSTFDPSCLEPEATGPDAQEKWFDIVLVSTDDAHQPGFQTEQTNEVWFLRGLDADGNIIYESPLSDDIPDHVVTQATYVDTANLTDVAYLQAVHGGDTTNANSVQAIALLNPTEAPTEDDPTQTTTPPGAAPQPTTTPPTPTTQQPTAATNGSTPPDTATSTPTTSNTSTPPTTAPPTTAAPTTPTTRPIPTTPPPTTARPTTTTTLEVALTLDFPQPTITLPPTTAPTDDDQGSQRANSTTCIEPGAAIADELSNSPVNSQVWRLYRTLLGRDPQLDGLNYWSSLRTSGATHFLIGKYLYFSPEAVDQLNLPGMDNTTFVEHLFANMSCRTPDPSGINYWTGLLDSGSSRWSVAVWFSESPEVLRRTGTFYSYIQ